MRNAQPMWELQEATNHDVFDLVRVVLAHRHHAQVVADQVLGELVVHDRGVGLEDRLEGTLAATALAASAGARVFRVHEVAATRRVVEMVAAIAGTRPPARTVRGLA